MGISDFATLDLWATLLSPLLATALFPMLNHRDEDDFEHAGPWFRRLMDHLPGCAWIKTAADGRYIYLNRAAKELFSPEIDYLGKTDADLFEPELAALCRENDRKVLTTVKVVETVEPMVSKGEQRFLLVSRFPILDEDGTVVMIAGTSVDITEHRRVEEELRRSESFRRAIIESEPECVKLVARDYTLMDMNPAGLELVEAATREQVVGQSVLDLLVPECRTAFVDMHRRVFNGESLVFEFEIVGLQGSHRWVETHASPLRDKESNVIAQLAISRDVTFHKRAKNAIKESRQYLRALFENSLDVILVTNDKGQYLDANPAACELLGYTYDELMKLSVTDLMPTSFRDQGGTMWDQFLANGSQHGEYLTLCKNGSVLALELRTARVMPGVYLSSGRDITERKRVEQAQRESKQQYESLVHSIDGIVWEVDARTFAFTFVSKQAERILGYPVEQWFEEPTFWRDHMHPDDRDWAIGYCLDSTAKRVDHQFEYRMISADGRVVWLRDIVSVQIADDDSVVLRGVMVEITDRKLAEQTLRESEERYRELFENAKDPTYVHDLEGRYTSVNRAAEKLSGYTREEILGSTFIRMVPPEEVSNLRWQLCRKLAKEGETSYESEVIRKDGRRVAVEINSHLIYEKGVPVSIQGTARDITLRKAAEEKLKGSSEQLRALSARLHSAREEEGTRISREIHDELGSVLTSLKWDLEGAGEVLAEPIETSQLPGLRDKVQSLIKLTDTAITSIRRIASELRPSVLDDLGLVPAIEWQAQQFQKRTGILCDYESALENLRLDRDQSTAVFRILQEALTNVLRHAQATRVRIELIRENGHFTLSVSDNGIGIAEIDRFEQQLGILGMRERAHLIGARIEIKPGENQGTVVMVRVPLDASESAWQGRLTRNGADFPAHARLSRNDEESSTH